MDNLAEALEFVADLKDQNYACSEVEIAGRTYRRGSLFPVEEPEAPLLELHTLTGLVDYLTASVSCVMP